LNILTSWLELCFKERTFKTKGGYGWKTLAGAAPFDLKAAAVEGSSGDPKDPRGNFGPARCGDVKIFIGNYAD